MIRPLYIDVETLPRGAFEHREMLRNHNMLDAWESVAPVEALQALADAGKLKNDPAKDNPAAVKLWRGWSLLPSRAEVVTTCWAAGGRTVMGGYGDLGKTVAMVAAEREVTHVVGWNVGYDAAVLQCSALRAGSPMTAAVFAQPHYRITAQFRLYDRRPQLLDAMDLWHDNRGRGERKLETACEVFGIKREGNPIDGSQVLDAFMEDRDDEILAHNRADVRDLRTVFEALCALHGMRVEETW